MIDGTLLVDEVLVVVEHGGDGAVQNLDVVFALWESLRADMV
jgi:hypothetical protein